MTTAKLFGIVYAAKMKDPSSQNVWKFVHHPLIIDFEKEGQPSRSIIVFDWEIMATHDSIKVKLDGGAGIILYAHEISAITVAPTAVLAEILNNPEIPDWRVTLTLLKRNVIDAQTPTSAS